MKVKNKIIDNWAMFIAALFIVITMIYIVIKGDGIYLQIHDYLDGYAAVFKMFKDNRSFWTFGTELPFLGGVDRDLMLSDLKVYSWIHMIFPTFPAIVIGWYLKILMSIAGFVFLGKTIYGHAKDINIFIICGLIYGILPTYPPTPLGFASLPFLLAVLIRSHRNFEWKYILVLLVYPIFSDLSFFGIFICGYLSIFLVAYSISARKIAWRSILALIALSVGYIATEWRLFYAILFSNEDSLKASGMIGYKGWGEASKDILDAFFFGQYHSGSQHTVIILPICFIYFIYMNRNYIKGRSWKKVCLDPFNWLMVWQGFNCMIYGLDNIKVIKDIIALIFPPLKGFSFARTLWFSPFIWYFAFMMILCRLDLKKVVKFVLCSVAFIVACLYPSTYNHIRPNCIGAKTLDHLSYGEFYSTDLFDKIKNDIGYSGEWSIAFGMHPSIIEYNGIASLDGYMSYYPKKYKEKFRTLIEPELKVDPVNREYFDSWGGRAYIFSKDITYAPDRDIEPKKADMLIDPDVFCEMGGKYVFSRVEILNAEILGLNERGVYRGKGSPYTIYVYES